MMTDEKKETIDSIIKLMFFIILSPIVVIYSIANLIVKFIDYLFEIAVSPIYQKVCILVRKPIPNSTVQVKGSDDTYFKRVNEQLLTIKEAKVLGKYFRKYVGNVLTNKRGTVNQMTDKATDAAEDAAASFLNENGVIYLAYPYAQTKPDGDTNRAVLNGECIRILKIEQVEVNEKNTLIKGSQKEIKL